MEPKILLMDEPLSSLDTALNIRDRNTNDRAQVVIIINAVEDGYAQAEIAKYLKMSRPNVCKIAKKCILTEGNARGATPRPVALRKNKHLLQEQTR